MKNLVTIATHNGREPLDRLFKSIKQFDPGVVNFDILICDIKSDDWGDYKDYLSEKSQEIEEEIGVRTFISRALHNGYETEAILFSYKNYVNYDNYLFIHDSTEVKQNNWAQLFFDRLNECDVCAWLGFNFHFCLFEEEPYLRQLFGKLMLPEYGILGSMFACKRSALDEVNMCGLMPPPSECKMHAQAMERGWACIFKMAGLKVDFIAKGGTTPEELLSFPILNKYIYARGNNA